VNPGTLVLSMDKKTINPLAPLDIETTSRTGGLRSGQNPYDHDQKRSECPNHSVCQKRKAENECFKASVRQRFGSVLKQWKMGTDLKDKIIEIIELILSSSRDESVVDPKELVFADQHSRNGSLYSAALEPHKNPCKNSCGIIKQINDHNKLQFYKINFFIESLEKSRMSPIHIHRIHIFLQTRIFEHLKIQDYFEQMVSVESLYICKAGGTSGLCLSTSDTKHPCKSSGRNDTHSEAGGISGVCETSVPVDANITEITQSFYLHMPNICKTCYHKNHIKTFGVKKSVESLKSNGPGAFGNESLKPMTKMYLCMKCGEDNYVNFYERNKSKCRFCILAEKRGLDAEAIFNLEHKLAPSASKSHHCKHCHTEDPKNFRTGYKSLCYACYLNDKKERDKSKKLLKTEGFKEELGTEVSKGPKGLRTEVPYFCKDCETDLPFRFRRGYKTQCYECFLDAKREKESSKQSFKPKDNECLDSLVPGIESVLRPPVACKHCSDTNPRNFNIGMQSMCARCEELESESYTCKVCHLECLRNCFSAAQLANPPGMRICNLCDPEAIAALAIEKARKNHKCELCNENRPEEFYSGSKGKCKACIKEERKWKYRTESSLKS
jgi:hypothetical protein